MSISSVFSRFSAFGFSGSRSSVPAGCSVAVAAVPPGSKVVVGCARGVDGFFRSAFPGAEVFSVSSGRWGRGRGAYAARSVACVDAVAIASGLWVSFPASECPVGLLPSAKSYKCFSGSGSGTWASLAYALGCGIACLVYSPFGVPASWGLEPVLDCPGWFSSSPSAIQLSLF